MEHTLATEPGNLTGFRPVRDAEAFGKPVTYSGNVTITRVVKEGRRLRTVKKVYSGTPVLVEKAPVKGEAGEYLHLDLMWEYPLLSKTYLS